MLAIVQILQLGNLLASFIVPTIEAALKIKSHFELDPDYTVNVTTLGGMALKADQGTMDSVNAWRQSVGLPALAKSV